MHELVIGVFRRLQPARRTIEALRESGFFDNHIGLISEPGSNGDADASPSLGREAPLGASDLVSLGLPEHQARYYRRELEHGHTVVVVEAHRRATHALSLLDRHGSFERAVFRLMPRQRGRAMDVAAADVSVAALA
ncbi:hypothetical protein [Haliangium sp.]|uniref:hypothetical protein n=1 Tax=Haliangium sp. TaxID=2663208 RepID=UPI003D0997B8